MKDSHKRFTVTAALIYANGPIHIGHLAGCYLPADEYVRYLRSCGKDVLFISGTDEHGVPITIKAKKEGLTPQQVVNKFYGMIKSSFEDFGISFDIYSRTSREIHHKTASDFFTTLHSKKVFNEEVTEQFYDETAQQFLADRYIMGTCPHCSNPGAYGDQCENCGTSLSPMDLIQPHSTLSGSKPVKKSTRNWFLPLNDWQENLEKYIGSHKEWKPNVSGQCQSWLKQGLQPRAMTRDLDWGVKVPLPDTDGKVLYVWFDAPIGYISATKEYFDSPELRSEIKSPTALKTPDWETYWKADDSKLVHFIGKDNIVFHCLIFPTMLMAHGDYILPENVPANEFLNLEGNKISTSRNWAIWLHEYLEDFPGKQDELRYVLTSISPETKDSDFTWKDYQARVNNELVAIFGNFVNRVAVLMHKYYEGSIPTRNEILEEDKVVITAIETFPTKIANAIEEYRFREALTFVMDLARAGNKYLADTEPWKLIKTDEERVKTIMNLAAQVVAALSIVAEPFLPFTAATLVNQFKVANRTWENASNINILANGIVIDAPQLLFEKVMDETVEKQIEKLNASRPVPELEVKPIKDLITYEDFQKMDIRVATVLAAERVPKTTKLLKLTLDTGVDQRTVVSGIAEHYNPEDIIGSKVTFLANLAPRKIKGIESHGMILMASDSLDKLVMISPTAEISSGSEIN